ncbi:hypothetical protein [Litorimonas haliclonae]|uniref:hypothetical protein n=1 Tax=Litorimonas haliclonae TaxID=2081977 RepID=UPI0039EE5184
MIKTTLAITALLATGTTLPPVQEIQPVRGATLSVSQFNLDWGKDGLEATLAEKSDFALTLKLRGDHAVTLKF